MTRVAPVLISHPGSISLLFSGNILAKMPVEIVTKAAFEGLDSIPFLWPVIKAAPLLALLWVLKTYFGGARNTSERNLHSKVVMMTVRTSVDKIVRRNCLVLTQLLN